MRASTLTTCKILTIENFEAHIYWLVSPIISLVMDRKLIILFALFCQFQHESKKGKHSILLLRSAGCIRGYFQVLKTDSHFFWQERGIVHMMPIKLDYGSFLTYCFAFWWAHSLKLVPQCYWYELDKAILAVELKLEELLEIFFKMFYHKELCWRYFSNTYRFKKHLKGSFNIYVNRILAFFDHLPTPDWHFWRTFINFM